ncbi:hypothetical protein N7468_006729 [Penicillium chermesinum]|uniref:Uncharacterized protein n=1 Tax=Penicillium chermesinum TaxID=63820 RepID=A0A9W9NVK4_9EURO|nr:uncharacterized protein N7468_006729 [Penicillium chermesinum]KAJ5225504.1 hypothetical protein N7468_006729 [Penicillium chermesinum]KAJ6161269.1 hypothetical protein N7470_004665 [Penicillium chermesinum]
MQSKALLSLLLLTPALASPVAQYDDSYSVDDLSSEQDDILSSEIAYISSHIPNSILTVLETAIPETWLEEVMTNTADQMSIYEAAESGVFPGWYNSLPESVKAWATSEATAEETGLSSAIASVSSAAVTSESAATTSGSAMVTSTASSSGTTASDSSASSSPSSSASPSSTSNGAAPMATGSLAYSVAGAVGLLGLAVAL